MALTEYCVQKGKRSMQYILKTALGLFDEGVDSYETLEAWLCRKRSADDNIRRLAATCGWGDRELTANEKKYVPAIGSRKRRPATSWSILPMKKRWTLSARSGSRI